MELKNIDPKERKELYEQFAEHADPSRGKVQPSTRESKTRFFGGGNAKSRAQLGKADNKEGNASTEKHLDAQVEKEKWSSFSYYFFFLKGRVVGMLNPQRGLSNKWIQNKFLPVIDSLTWMKNMAVYLLTSEVFQKRKNVEIFIQKYPKEMEVLYRLQKLPVAEYQQNVAQLGEAEEPARGYLSLFLKDTYFFFIMPHIIANSISKGLSFLLFAQMIQKNQLLQMEKGVQPHSARLKSFRKDIDKIFNFFFRVSMSLENKLVRHMLHIPAQEFIGSIVPMLETKYLDHLSQVETQSQSKYKDVEERQKEAQEQEELERIAKLKRQGSLILRLFQKEFMKKASLLDTKALAEDKLFIISEMLEFISNRYFILFSGSFLETSKEYIAGKTFDIGESLQNFYQFIEYFQKSLKDYVILVKQIEIIQDQNQAKRTLGGAQDQPLLQTKTKLFQDIYYKLRETLVLMEQHCRKVFQNEANYITNLDSPLGDKIVSANSLMENPSLHYTPEITAQAIFEEFYSVIFLFHSMTVEGNLISKEEPLNIQDLMQGVL